MLTLTGTLIHSFKSPQGETKEGKSYGGDYKIQILGQIDLPNGDSRKDLITLTCHTIDEYSQYLNQDIRVPVGVFVNGKNPAFFIPKGSKPEIASF